MPWWECFEPSFGLIAFLCGPSARVFHIKPNTFPRRSAFGSRRCERMRPVCRSALAGRHKGELTIGRKLILGVVSRCSCSMTDGSPTTFGMLLAWSLALLAPNVVWRARMRSWGKKYARGRTQAQVTPPAHSLLATSGGATSSISKPSAAGCCRASGHCWHRRMMGWIIHLLNVYVQPRCCCLCCDGRSVGKCTDGRTAAPLACLRMQGNNQTECQGRGERVRHCVDSTSEFRTYVVLFSPPRRMCDCGDDIHCLLYFANPEKK